MNLFVNFFESMDPYCILGVGPVVGEVVGGELRYVRPVEFLIILLVYYLDCAA